MRAFVAGRVPLAVAFWRYAILYGTAINLVATIAALAAQVAGWPDMLALMLFLLPVPYTLLTIPGVWRSAAAYGGPDYWPTWARFGVVAWAIVMLAV